MNQKQKLANFVNVTGLRASEAKKVLVLNEWNLERALDSFYTHQSETQIRQNPIFEAYKDDGDIIGPVGTEKLCSDLGIDPSDVVTLVLSWHMKCPAMCEFTRDGFEKGCEELGVETLEQLKNSIPKMRQELIDPQTGKQIYQFVFTIARVENQKNISQETAIAFWVLLIGSRYEHMAQWKQFLEEEHGKAISKDTWNLFWDFVMTHKPDYSDHDSDGAWPVLIDRYVDWVKNKL